MMADYDQCTRSPYPGLFVPPVADVHDTRSITLERLFQLSTTILLLLSVNGLA